MKKKEIIRSYLKYDVRDGIYDTVVNTLKIMSDRRADSLLLRKGFLLNGTHHTISLYTDFFRPGRPIDASSEMFYTLDSLGIIYRSDTYWQIRFSRLRTNDDSVNNLISTAIDVILLDNDLRCKSREIKLPMEGLR